jgi:general nucleoside transport system ATP-binding protein
MTDIESTADASPVEGATRLTKPIGSPRSPSTARTLLKVSRLSKSFGDFTALSDADFELAVGEVLCLLGENGAGKSTLCNIVFGVHQPDSGKMIFAGQAHSPQKPADALAAGIAMVHQHFSVIPTMTVVENLMLGRAKGILNRAAFSKNLIRVAEEYGFELDPDRLISDLSVGERQRVEIIKCLMLEPKLLLLDEPTAVLPPSEISSLLNICRSVADSGRSVVLVTHKLAEISSVADRVCVMRGGRTVSTVDLANANIATLVGYMVGSDAKALGGAAAANLGVLEKRNPTKDKSARHTRIDQTPSLDIEGLRFDDSSGTTRLDNISLTVKRGEILGVAGVQGNGQTELGAILAGMLRPTAGRITVGGNDITGKTPRQITASGVGIVPEDRHAVGGIGQMSVAENLFLSSLSQMSRFGVLQRRKLLRKAADLMERFDIRAAGPDSQFQSLSGGNQQKAVLARELTIDPLLFLLAAEPTRGLDVGAVSSVYGHIRHACDSGSGVLLISSELDELITISHRMLVIYRGRIVGQCASEPGNRERIGAMMSGHYQ